MAEWPPSRQMAALYQSPGPNGIGFARYASSGTVTPELWENIKYTEAEAQRRPEDPAVEGWGDDMELLRELLRFDGVTEQTDKPIDLEDLKEMVKTALNSGSGDTEWATLVDIGGILGLEYDDEKDTYQ